MAFVITAFMIAVLFVLFLLLIKFLVWKFIFIRGDDSVPIIPTSRENFWQEYDRLRAQRQLARQPPPDFEEALRNSRPVSYIDIGEEEQPPTYDDFLKSQTPSPTAGSPLEESEGPNNVWKDSFESQTDPEVNSSLINYMDYHCTHPNISPFEDDFNPLPQTLESSSLSLTLIGLRSNSERPDLESEA